MRLMNIHGKLKHLCLRQNTSIIDQECFCVSTTKAWESEEFFRFKQRKTFLSFGNLYDEELFVELVTAERQLREKEIEEPAQFTRVRGCKRDTENVFKTSGWSTFEFSQRD